MLLIAAEVSCSRIALVADISAAPNLSAFDVKLATFSATKAEKLLAC